MARFLVTGGAGFIGSNIVDNLLKEGHFVRVLDNFFSGNEENLNVAREFPATQFELIRGDVRDVSACHQACKWIDYVIHQAALRSVPKSMMAPDDFNAVNIQGTLNMLRAATDNHVKRFVFASSSSIYGDTTQFPQTENQQPRLISPYALTKLAGEYYCRIFSMQFGLETVCLRYFNVFGPKQAADDEYAVVIPKFIQSIYNDEQPPIFGTGQQSRDFTYIDNIVQANVLSATTSGIKHDIFNVASGKSYTVLILVSLLNKILGKAIKPKFFPPRMGDIFKTHADISHIQERFDFEVRVDFEEGLRRTVDYFKSAHAKCA